MEELCLRTGHVWGSDKEGALACAFQVIGLSPGRCGGSGASMIVLAKERYFTPNSENLRNLVAKHCPLVQINLIIRDFTVL